MIGAFFLRKNKSKSFSSKCKKNCGTPENPVNFPIPNCTKNCYSISEKPGAFGYKYVGGFKDSKKEGQGKTIYPDGTISKGIWKFDKLVE